MALKREPDRRKLPTRKLPGHLERRRGEGGARQNVIGIKDRIKGYVANHREVAFVSLKRLLAAPVPSIMTWAVIAIALALPAGLYVFLQNAQQLSSGWDRAAQISVFMQLEVSEKEGRSLSDEIGKRPDVKEVRYISREQALAEFRELSGFGEALEYLDSNPLPSVIVVFPETESGSLATTETLLAELQALPQVDQAQLDLKWVQRLYSIMALGQRAVLILGGLLSLAVLLVIGNTIRLAIEARRAEIVVVKLVGGTDAFVRRPFLYTGVWYGVGGGLIAWLLINLVLFWLYRPVSELVSVYGSDFHLAGLGVPATLVLLSLSALLGLLGAWVAVGRHLSNIEPK